MALYRFDSKTGADEELQYPRATVRPPGNVPYIVDNLWEWARPDGFPSRRRAVFASPCPDLAKASSGLEQGRLCVVIPGDGARIAQISQEDAKFHPDVRALPKLVLSLLGSRWPSLSASDKQPLSLLWAPCLSQDEVEQLFSEPAIAEYRQSLFDSISMWREAEVISASQQLSFEKGEVFFEADRWTLLPTKAGHLQPPDVV